MSVIKKALASVAAPVKTAPRRQEKSAKAFRTISEVADELEIPQHVLRFWETRFTQVRPIKKESGRRYYRPEDVELLRAIRELLYDKGFAIKGVQKLIRDGALRLTPEGAVFVPSEAEQEPAPLTEARHAQEKEIGDLPLFTKATSLTDQQVAELKLVLSELEELRARLVDALRSA
ncbi:MAG TPA: MerR family transcriptional regulator [Dongiaceae bacterium]|jgi:DNA-binding transcriptional MerR regulator|nr:MerR family transcriptional regulator [Dongiaceae bacterium]